MDLPTSSSKADSKSLATSRRDDLRRIREFYFPHLHRRRKRRTCKLMHGRRVKAEIPHSHAALETGGTQRRLVPRLLVQTRVS